VQGVIEGPDAQGNYTLVDGSAGYGAQYTYFAVATYADGIRSDPSNLVTLATPTLAVATATAVTGVYNGSAYSGNGVCSDGLVPVFTYAGGAAPVDAGTTEFTMTCGGDNYVTATAKATIEISPAPVTATAGSGSTTYDGLTHAPSACVVTGAYTGDLSCLNSPNLVGPAANTYVIGLTVAGTGLANFAITPVDGSYTITPKQAVATATPVAGVYNGSAYLGNGACSDGLVPVFTYAGGAAPVLAGTTSFSVRCSGNNYLPATATATIDIAKATPVFSGLSAPTILAGATPTALGGTISAGSLIPAGTVSITLNGQTQSATILATGAFSSSFLTGALTAAAPYTITYTYSPPDNANFTAAGPDNSKRLTVQQPYALVGLQNVAPVTITKTKAGSAVPMKWHFKNGSNVVNSSQVGHRVTVNGPTSFVVNNTDPGGSSFRYDATTNSWAFNLQTKGTNGVAYPIGNYTVTITPTTPGFGPSPSFTLTLTK
jgi:hypothetical protein